MAGVSPSTLRLWESQGLIEPIRTPSGQRLFDSSHIDRLKMISYLRTEKGLNPAAIREQLKQESADADTDSASNEEELTSGSNLSIGQKIRRMRREAAKTLDAVARDLDIPISLLSTFERTSQGLSLKGMHDLANYFGTTITSLSGQEEPSGAESLIRSGRWSTWPTTFSGVTIQCLAEGRNQMECHRFVLAPAPQVKEPTGIRGRSFCIFSAETLRLCWMVRTSLSLRQATVFTSKAHASTHGEIFTTVKRC